jgi:hypothetical protein
VIQSLQELENNIKHDLPFMLSDREHSLLRV